MNRWMYVCLIVGLLLLAAPTGASIPDTIKYLTASPEWVTAGSGETSSITAQVKNGTTSLSGVTVTFTVNGTDGTVSPMQRVTDHNGTATVTFRPGTVAGTATIMATVSHEGLEGELAESIEQKVDHATPYAIANLWYEPEVTAGEETNIIIRMVDRYGNPVDSRREAETVKFTVGSAGGGAAFVEGDTVPVDENGNATARLRVDTLAGENIIYIQPPKPVGNRYITIRSAADGVPTAITCEINPSTASVPANGKDKITLMYTLTDKYGNPAGGNSVWVNASGLYSQSKLINSSSYGEVWITFGPEDSIGIVDITATVVENPAVTVTKRVEFTSTDPTKMVLTASPQTMPSRDLKDDIVSELRAKVMDIKGNPVSGEKVTFEIISNCSVPYNQTLDQTLMTNSAITNSDGYAIVKFRPGAFTNDRKAQNWSPTAKGTATIQATWKNETLGHSDTQSIDLTWMNYPYLSVETEVSNTKVAVNSTDEHTTNTTDVTIRLKGDGYAMEPDPVDVVLVIDRSGSMKWDINRNSGTSNARMKAAKSAASTFISQMDPDRDRVGLISFSSSTTTDNALGDPFNEVNENLNDLKPDGATQLRRAIYEAILMQKENKDDPDAIKAVVIMTDGDWNYDGSPIAHGTGYPANSSQTFSGNTLESDKYRYYDGLGGTLKYNKCTDGKFTNQNMSHFASANDVKLYTITFAYNPHSTVTEAMGILATSTGGFYEHAGSGEKLTDIYKRIAGELKTEAGVDTSMTVFRNVEIGGAIIDAFEVFDYRHVPGKSTTIESWIKNGTENYPVINFTTINQTDDWRQNKSLHFDIGTIHLDQTWETTFRLVVNASYEAGEENNINIFGPGAVISFNDGTETLELPDTFITVFPDLTNTGATTSSLAVAFTGPVSGSGPYTDFVPLNWTTTYKGSKEVDLSLAYSRYEDMRSPTAFYKKNLPPGNFMAADNTTTGSTMLPVNDLTPGQYWITITASARDAEVAKDRTDVWAHSKDQTRAYIKIG
ncbi:MAG: VWA domain-containing protein [Methanomicrobiales archaeon]|nr:VWA domain-containing protein [Methanomicrobiales archaeon]